MYPGIKNIASRVFTRAEQMTQCLRMRDFRDICTYRQRDTQNYKNHNKFKTATVLLLE